VVDEVTGSGKMAACKDLDHGQKRRCGGSAEDSIVAWGVRGGHDDGMGSQEIFGGKF
jgi:hypothetical protein